MSFSRDISRNRLSQGRAITLLIAMAFLSDNDFEYLTGVSADRARSILCSGCAGQYGDPDAIRVTGSALAIACNPGAALVGLLSAIVAHGVGLADSSPLDRKGLGHAFNVRSKIKGYFSNALMYSRLRYGSTPPARTAFAISTAGALAQDVWQGTAIFTSAATVLPDWMGMFSGADPQTGNVTMTSGQSTRLIAQSTSFADNFDTLSGGLVDGATNLITSAV